MRSARSDVQTATEDGPPGSSAGARLGAERTIAGATAAKTFEPMPGRPMKEYVVVPDAVVTNPAKLRAWVDQAYAYAKKLPAKKAR